MMALGHLSDPSVGTYEIRYWIRCWIRWDPETTESEVIPSPGILYNPIGSYNRIGRHGDLYIYIFFFVLHFLSVH
jgi:hypothetical protein